MNQTLEFQKFCRGEFEREAASDFFTLRRCPSTLVCRFLEYFSGLSQQDREALGNAASLWAAMRMGSNKDIAAHETLQQNEAWKRWVNWSVQNGWRFPSISHLRDRVGQAGMDHSRGIASDVGEGIKELTKSARAVNSAELRKRAKKALDDLFCPQISNRGGGWWKYEGNLNGARLSVDIAYASNYHQLHYEVNLESDNPACKFERIGFERVLGIGWGQWDFIVEENVDDTMRLLAEFINYVSLIPSRLPAGCLPAMNNENKSLSTH